jgi:Zn-dependent protease
MTIGDEMASGAVRWGTMPNVVPTGYTPTGWVLWQRRRFVLHASAIPGIVLKVAAIAFFVWMPGELNEHRLYGITAAALWGYIALPLLHEAAHAAVGRRLGLELIGFGLGRRPYVRLRSTAAVKTPLAWAWMAAAGPACDLAVGTTFVIAWRMLGAEASTVATVFLLFAAIWQIAFGIFGFLPMPGNDGSIIVQMLNLDRLPRIRGATPNDGFTLSAARSDDKADVLALFTDEVIKRDRLVVDHGQRLDDTYDGDIAELYCGIPARMLVRDSEGAIAAYLHLDAANVLTENLGPAVWLGAWIRQGESSASMTAILASSVAWLHDEARFDVVWLGAMTDEETSILKAAGMHFAANLSSTFEDGTIGATNVFASFSPAALGRARGPAPRLPVPPPSAG